MIIILLCLLAISQFSHVAGQCNGANEEFTNCAVTCNTCDWVRSLNALQTKITCDLDNCKPGCDCKPGFHRENNGKCIRARNCLRCGSKPNQSFVAFQQNYCQTSCSSPSLTTINCAPPPNPTNPKYPLGSCRCDPGFVWNRNRQCIRLNQCTAADSCTGDNESWDWSIDGCDNIDCDYLLDPKTPPCKTVFSTKAACKCYDGYYRAYNNVCVLQEECMCSDPLALMTNDPNPCPGGTCKQPWYDACNLQPKEYGCACRRDFLLDANNKCILISHCPPIIGGNEEYGENTYDLSCSSEN